MRVDRNPARGRIRTVARYGRWLGALGLRLAGEPQLWATAARQGAHLIPRGWWRSASHLPLPPEAYLRFRSVTAYGGDGTVLPSPDDVVTWLAWSRQWRLSMRQDV